MRKRLVRLLKEETVLCAALALAVLSAFPAHPDAEYLSYIDFRTLAILFCLMEAMAGLQKTGVFQQIARALLSGVSKTRQLALILTLLCFFSAMVVTNDVALITFVPFTFTVLNLIGTEARRRLAVPIIVLQTVAANLGSMLTPIGNPQNLYLYGKANLSPGAFLQLMLPYTCVSFLLIVLWCTIQSAAYDVPVKISFCDEIQTPDNRMRPAGYLVLFALDLLTVTQIIPYQSALLITVVGLLILDRSIFFRIDYSLLLTFVGFFIFIGNMGGCRSFTNFCSESFLVTSCRQVYSPVRLSAMSQRRCCCPVLRIIFCPLSSGSISAAWGH